MATDLLGPASVNAVTVRPDDERAFGIVDTWLKDCSSASAEDGTEIMAGFLNNLLAQVRRAIRGMGITPEDNADDDMLLKAIQASSNNNSVLNATATLYLDLYPVVKTADNKLTITPSTGQVIVGTAQVIVRRGVFPKNTTDYTAGQRTFATTANKTYHLRWNAVDGFSLKDLANVGYNPGALAETAAAFDSTYDDMLCARVVTDGANNPTVTALVNRQDLRKQTKVSLNNLGRALNWTSAGAGSALALDWARTPPIANPALRMIAQRQDVPDGSDGGGGTISFIGVREPAAGVTRYGAANAEYIYDDSENNNFSAEFTWFAVG